VNQEYLTPAQFAEMMGFSVFTAIERCKSKAWRVNKIAKKEGRFWRIDMNRYQKYWAGELK